MAAHCRRGPESHNGVVGRGVEGRREGGGGGGGGGVKKTRGGDISEGNVDKCWRLARGVSCPRCCSPLFLSADRNFLMKSSDMWMRGSFPHLPHGAHPPSKPPTRKMLPLPLLLQRQCCCVQSEDRELRKSSPTTRFYALLIR